MNKEVFRMFSSEQQIFNACTDEPSLIFNLVKRGCYEMVEELVDEGIVSVNECDTLGNDLVTRMLKARQYELVLKFMKKRNWDVNHQNIDGNTFGHILALDDSVAALKIVEQLTKKKNYIPNIKNNKGETVLDRAINSNYVFTAFKILEDKRFNSIDVVSFKKLCNSCVKNTYYGKYAKLNNLEIIVNNLEKKDLDTTLRYVVEEISDNMETIKTEIMKNKSLLLDSIIDASLVQI
jgi:ankyrin repeat protein